MLENVRGRIYQVLGCRLYLLSPHDPQFFLVYTT